jgi:hypothetical protein
MLYTTLNHYVNYMLYKIIFLFFLRIDFNVNNR